jgi:hypothetical protein
MSKDWSLSRQVGSESLLYESELLGTDGLARTNKPLGSASSLTFSSLTNQVNLNQIFYCHKTV